MSFTFKQLLALKPAQRDQDLHHKALDDFVRTIGGSPFQERFDPPVGMKNADYLLPGENGHLIVELKQLTGHASGGSLGEHMQKFVRNGWAQPALSPPRTTLFDQASLHPHAWSEFNRSFRKSVPNAIASGYRQLKQTSSFLLQQGERVSARAIWLHNAGDLHMPPDLLARQALIHVKKEWRSGHFRSLDFVMCTCWDLWDNPWIKIRTVTSPQEEGLQRPPFHWHTIFPGKQTSTNTNLADRLRAEWINYVCEAYGALQLDHVAGSPPVGALTRFAFRLSTPTVGWETLAETALVPVAAISIPPDPAPPPA